MSGKVSEEGRSPEDMASSTALKAAKKELRTLMKQKLSKISTESVNAQSNVVFKTITSFRAYQEAKMIGIYLSMPTGEIHTHALVRHALASGKKVFVPYLHKAKSPSPDAPCSVMDMVDLRSLSDYDSLKRDSWGIPTVGADTVHQREHVLENSTQDSAELDMILVPGVAFDIDPKTGFVKRLGHGKGYYDYFLHRYRESRASHAEEPSTSPGTDVLLYGLALEEQYLKAKSGSSVPVGEYDSLLHGLIVGDGELVEGPLK